MNPCVIFDIDGTLADNRARVTEIMGGSYDTYQAWTQEKWDLFYAGIERDRPIVPMVKLARSMSWPVLFVTGRKERGRHATWKWLQIHVWNRAPLVVRSLGSHRLFMRGDEDDRPSWQVKEDHLKVLQAGGVWDPIIAFDDSPHDSAMYKRNGLIAAHVGSLEALAK